MSWVSNTLPFVDGSAGESGCRDACSTREVAGRFNSRNQQLFLGRMISAALAANRYLTSNNQRRETHAPLKERLHAHRTASRDRNYRYSCRDPIPCLCPGPRESAANVLS